MRLLPDEEHSAARRFLVSGSIWLCLATLGGLASAIQLFSPDVLRNIPVLEFGRVRPLHTNLVLFGFVGLMSIGAGLYIAPVMLRTRLHGERLAHLSLWLFNLALLGAVITLPLGFTQGREYAELIFPIKLLFLAALLLLLYVLIMTLLRRRENLLYVSVWYICGGVLWTAILFPFGNVM
jgi:cbb3-type cytochrome oxidase subunit 1